MQHRPRAVAILYSGLQLRITPLSHLVRQPWTAVLTSGHALHRFATSWKRFSIKDLQGLFFPHDQPCSLPSLLQGSPVRSVPRFSSNSMCLESADRTPHKKYFIPLVALGFIKYVLKQLISGRFWIKLKLNQTKCKCHYTHQLMTKVTTHSPKNKCNLYECGCKWALFIMEIGTAGPKRVVFRSRMKHESGKSQFRFTDDE